MYMFSGLMDSKKQKNRQREIQYVQYQQYSIQTCILYNNKQFTGLLLDITLNLFNTAFFITPLALLLPKLPIHIPNLSHKEALSRDTVYMYTQTHH